MASVPARKFTWPCELVNTSASAVKVPPARVSALCEAPLGDTITAGAIIVPPFTVTSPSMVKPPPERPSTCTVELLTWTFPPRATRKPFRTSRGTSVPASSSESVLIEPMGAESVRLLMVRVSGKNPAVMKSIVTVLLPALVTRTADCVASGGPSNQFPPSSHAPSKPLVQRLTCAGAERASTRNRPSTSKAPDPPATRQPPTVVLSFLYGPAVGGGQVG